MEGSEIMEGTLRKLIIHKHWGVGESHCLCLYRQGAEGTGGGMAMGLSSHSLIHYAVNMNPCKTILKYNNNNSGHPIECQVLM